MPTAVKAKLSLLEKGQQWRKTIDFDNYIKRLVSVYTDPLSACRYSYAELEDLQTQAAAAELDNRFRSDRAIILRLLLDNYEQAGDWQQALTKTLACLCECDRENNYDNLSQTARAILAQSVLTVPTRTSKRHDSAYYPPSQRAKLVAGVLDQLIEDGKIPRFFEFDHIDDIVPIIESRYAGPREKHWSRSDIMIRALSALCTGNPDLPRQELSAALHSILGDNHPYLPKRGGAHPNLQKMIPDLFNEFISLNAAGNPSRFLDINKEYSYRQRVIAGAKDNPWGIPLLGGFEQDHHLMLRTLLALRQKGAISPDDEVLVVGPRYPDELTFFRRYIGLSKTIGLDLFEDKENGIVAGDMHDTGFAPQRFGLIYCAGTLNYAYNIRKVIAEFARILKRPGYLILTDNADRVNGVDPLGRSDPTNADTLVGLFYQYQINVLAKDNGKTPFPSMFHCWPCVALEILG